MGAPMRRAQRGDAAAILVDEHRRVGPADAGAQRVDQPSHLRGIEAIALEEDEAERIDGAEEIALLGRQRRAGTTEGNRARLAHRITLIASRTDEDAGDIAAL